MTTNASGDRSARTRRTILSNSPRTRDDQISALLTPYPHAHTTVSDSSSDQAFIDALVRASDTESVCRVPDGEDFAAKASRPQSTPSHPPTPPFLARDTPGIPGFLCEVFLKSRLGVLVGER